MADLSRVAEAIPGGGVRKYRGVVVTDGGIRKVSVGGQLLLATWADPLVVDDGDVVDVEVAGSGEGGAGTHVPSRTTLQPRPKTATVAAVPSSSPTIVVEDSAGVSYDAEFIGTYAVNDKVHLDWGAGRPRVIGRVTTTAAPVAPAAPPPIAGVESGEVSAAANHSNTYWGPGGWGSWAGGGENVYQGNYGSGPVSGAWFYGSPFSSLAGKAITRVRFRTGQRRSVGASGPATFHFYAHTSSSLPGGDVSRVAGPFDVVLAQGQGPTWVDLPTEFGAIIAAGGGIAIYGDPYAGMSGRLQQVDSGALILNWQG